jgi:hypothetical protein
VQNDIFAQTCSKRFASTGCACKKLLFVVGTALTIVRGLNRFREFATHCLQGSIACPHTLLKEFLDAISSPNESLRYLAQPGFTSG